MVSISHPSKFISFALVNALRELSSLAEKSGELQPAQLSIIYEENWFNLFVPAEYKGLGLTLPDGLRIEEGLAWTDGSLGWTVTLCSGASWFCGFLPPDMAASLFNNDKVCFAGSGQPSGIAKINEHGYEISGLWKYATGASHATVFTANCLLEDKGGPIKNEDGSATCAFLFLNDEVSVVRDWQSIGLVATASHSFKVDHLQVPFNRSFRIDSKYALLNSPLYQYPFLQFAEATLAVNNSGMAMHFMDLCGSILTNRALQHYPAERIAFMRALLTDSQKVLDKARNTFYEAVDKSWEMCLSEKIIPVERLAAVSSASRSLAKTSRQLADDLYPCCGLVAANPSSEINQVWRDMHTASQHPLLNYPVPSQ